MYTLLIICSLTANSIANHGNICTSRTVSNNLTQDQCNTQEMQQSIRDNNQGELVYCIPNNIIKNYSIP